MLLLGFLCLAVLTSATPYSGFPFSQQLPDVARVGEQYSFSISKETYQTDDGSVAYSVEDLPDWLSFDESSLTFSGIPSSSDATNSLSFNLVGKDNSGTYNQTVSIVVSDEAGPELKDSIFSQLESIGNTNGYDGLVVEPEKSFKIQFSNDTFEMSSGSTNKIIAYYGKSLNRTSLPSWCYFDEDTLTFSGTAPAINSQIAPSQDFGFILIATDYEGYTGAYGSFYLVVGAHELTTNVSSDLQIRTSAGNAFNVELPLEDVLLDGVTIDSANISKVSLYEAPSWVSLNSSRLTGTVPRDQDSNVLVNVTVNDVYGNSVFLNFEIDIYSDIFTTDDFPDVNATRGEFFVYSLPSDDFSNLNSTSIKANFSDANWLTYYYTNHSFAGNVPDDFDETEVNIEASMNSLSDSREFTIRGVGTVHSSSSSSSSKTSSSSASSGTAHSTSSSTAVSSPSATSTSKSKSSSDSKKKLAIGLGVALPLAALLAALLIFCCCWRRRKSQADDDEDTEKKKDAFYINPQGTAETLKNDPDGDHAKRLSALNVLKLDEAAVRGDDASSLTNVDSTHSRSQSLYNEAMAHQSTDELIPGPSQKITKSWRNSASKWKPRDSLTSLATVATTDLMTVRVTDDPNLQRKSQGMFFNNRNSSYVSSSSGNYVNYDQSSSSDYVDALDRPRDLTTLDEELPRDYSDSNLSKSSAKFVDVQRKGSQAVNVPRNERSFEGVIENSSNNSSML
ncbi:hypothetical protein OGAPHI_001780 [Ogataea philodendri]|uniref:Dystroglycan-type cadherin-like domain-containing protein n=1 Tax=Ogataea philodendri TaxID=1378263 RepID=A0A9P8T6P1_9ASCO|nr:uncharacterized protein OGAPHI_001780 [Ogataea philodendri]KAH3668026.1 hypothetical protein OGAPHI_001780 [Ogataea philodendri]